MATSFLSSLHYNLYNKYYDECVQELIKDNNYKTQKQVFQCVKDKTPMKILGTILFREGSIFE